MFCEFTLEPKLVATWHDRKEFLFFQEKFGLKTKRVVSAYPKKWISMVWRAFRNSPYGQDQNAEKKLDALLRDLSQNMVKRRSTFSEISVWLERAEAEHVARPFHALLARDNPRQNAHVIAAGKLIAEGHHPRWSVPENTPVPRNALDMAVAVTPVLSVCRHIVFIDPYFDPSKPRFTAPMKAYLSKIWANRCGSENPKVEMHTSIERFFKKPGHGGNRNAEAENSVCDHLVGELKARLPRIIPLGKQLTISVWKQRERGEKLHNRYILSEICGVGFGIGLDQNDNQESSETDDLYMMEPPQRLFRWQQYLGNPVAFDPVVDPFVIDGRFK